MTRDKHEMLVTETTYNIEQITSTPGQYVLLRRETGTASKTKLCEMFRYSRNNLFTLKWMLRALLLLFLLWLFFSSSSISALFRVKGLRATISEQNAEPTREVAKATTQQEAPPDKIITGDLNQIKDTGDRKLFVKQMMMHAWDGYKRYAWGSQELDPIRNRARTGALFDAGNGAKLGLTIVDALSTLKMMGLNDRFLDGRNWVRDNFKPDVYPGSASVFEWNIRYVGGLLSAYALTKDEMFKQKSIEAADFLLPAFSSATGIPYSTVYKGGGSNRGGTAVLSEMGSLHLEFEYLSFITGNNSYAQKVHRLREALRQKPKKAGLYPSMISPDNPNSDIMGGKVTFGAMSDSFYEYLLKEWLITNKKDNVAKEMYVESVKAMEKSGVIAKAKDGVMFTGELRYPSLGFAPIMDHFACFAGGMFALHGHVLETSPSQKDHWLGIGKGIGKGCHEGYAKTSTGLGPDRITFHGNKANGGGGYFQRPEAIETWFYLWRITKDPIYREWAWDFVKAIEKHTRTESGYTGLHDVNNANAKDGTMQSFYLGETLKYLYLIFCEDSIIPIDQWVFNTEAHPLPVHDPVILSS